MHFYTDKGLPYYANTYSDVNSIFEFTNLVGRPNCLRCAYIEWANFAKVSNPLGKTIV